MDAGGNEAEVELTILGFEHFQVGFVLHGSRCFQLLGCLGVALCFNGHECSDYQSEVFVGLEEPFDVDTCVSRDADKADMGKLASACDHR